MVASRRGHRSTNSPGAKTNEPSTDRLLRPATHARGPPKKGRFGRDIDILSLLLEGRAFIALIVLIIIFALLSDSFLNFANLVTMTKQSPTTRSSRSACSS